MVVVPLECDGPAFETVNLYWPLPPAVNTPCATLVIVKSKLIASGVVGVETGPLLARQEPVMHSAGLLTLTIFAPSGLGALGEIWTSSTNMLLPPETIGFGLVQVTLGTVPEHVQPAVEDPLML